MDREKKEGREREREERRKRGKGKEGGREGGREKRGEGERRREGEHTSTQCLGIPPGIPPPPQLICCGFEQLLLPRGHNTIGPLTVQVHMCMYRCGCARALPGRGGGRGLSCQPLMPLTVPPPLAGSLPPLGLRAAPTAEGLALPSYCHLLQVGLS